MKTIDQTKTTQVFYQVVKNQNSIKELIRAVKEDTAASSERYAYQAFCCAMLAKESKSYIQKGKYIKQYGQFISKALFIDEHCTPSRLIRLLIECKLEGVAFKSHIEEDTVFLLEQLDNITDEILKELIITATENE